MIELPNSPSSNAPAAREFEDSLKNLDAQRGSYLTVAWRECLRMHDENEMLRLNVRQLHTVLQAEMASWAATRGMIQKRIQEINGDNAATANVPLIGLEELRTLLQMNESLAKTLAKLSTAVRDVRKEIRASEFQSRFFFHVNQIQTFMLGLTAVLAKHFQSTGQLDAAVADIRKLSREMTVNTEGRLLDEHADTE
jgi:hypothetical protein